MDVGGGWWEGELNGQVGLFPESYVQINVGRRRPCLFAVLLHSSPHTHTHTLFLSGLITHSSPLLSFCVQEGEAAAGGAAGDYDQRGDDYTPSVHYNEEAANAPAGAPVVLVRKVENERGDRPPCGRELRSPALPTGLG
jgi:hypothetical protein